MSFSNKPSSVVIIFCLYPLISTQQVHTGPVWSSPSKKYQTLTLEENQEVERQIQRMREREVVAIPDVPKEINTPLELISAQLFRDVVLPNREQEYELIMQGEDQRLQANMVAAIQDYSLILDGLPENFSTILSPPCIDLTKPISANDQEKCKKVREKTRHALLVLRDGVQEAQSLAEDSQVSANERKRMRGVIADKKRNLGHVIDQYEREPE